MKKISSGLVCTALATLAFGQTKLIKDIDRDGKKDTVYVHMQNAVIVCKLSTQNYKSVSSKPIELLNEQCGIEATKNGFQFFNDWMRSGYKNQFRYNPETKKVQLIGMSKYAFGNASNDGSGSSSVNLLTGDYIGSWNYFDEAHNRLNKIPTIRTKMKLTPVNLQDFNDAIYFGFDEKCTELYYRHKEMDQKSRSTN